VYHSSVFEVKNKLKLTYGHIELQKFFRGYTPGPPLKGRGGKGEGEERVETDGEGSGGEGR
jgi:hypothetical protein